MNTTQRTALVYLTTADIRTVYSGKPGCMCGCNGNHTANPTHRAEADKKRGYAYEDEDVSERNVKRVLAKVQGDSATAEADDDCAWFSIETATRVYVVYLCDAAMARIKATAVAA